MTDITIPPEALEAAAKVLHYHAEIFDDLPWEDLSDTDQEAYIDEARAACLAMLKAWPGMEHDPGALVTETYRDPGKIILPLTQENTDV